MELRREKGKGKMPGESRGRKERHRRAPKRESAPASSIFEYPIEKKTCAFKLSNCNEMMVKGSKNGSLLFLSF